MLQGIYRIEIGLFLIQVDWINFFYHAILYSVTTLLIVLSIVLAIITIRNRILEIQEEVELTNVNPTLFEDVQEKDVVKTKGATVEFKNIPKLSDKERNARLATAKWMRENKSFHYTEEEIELYLKTGKRESKRKSKTKTPNGLEKLI